MIVIFLLSNEISGVSSGRSGAIVHILTHSLPGLPQQILTLLTRKAAHTIAYFILGILIYNVVKEYNFTTRRAILLSIGLAFSYACSDEFHQLFVQGRSPEITDVLIDTTASTLGVYSYYLIHKRRKNSVNSNNKL
jgi:VanZ family protein